MSFPIIISIDESKKKVSGYSPSSADKFHSQSAKLANKDFDQALKESNCSDVILMCGGSASGKTEFLSVYLGDFHGIIFDSTLPTIEGAEIKIKRIRKAGKTPFIYAVLPDDIKRAFIAFLGRDRKFSDEHFYRTHSGSRMTLLSLVKGHIDLEVKIFESSYVKNNLIYKEILFSNRKELIEFLENNQYTEDQVLNIVKTI